MNRSRRFYWDWDRVFYALIVAVALCFALLASASGCAGKEPEPVIMGMPATEASCTLLVCDSWGQCTVVGEPGDDLCHFMEDATKFEKGM